MKIEHETATANIASPTVNSFADKAQAVTEPVLSVDSRTQVTQLVRNGIAEAKAGNLPAARESLLSAIDIDNRHETALMWLASISDKPQELLSFLQRVLVINPDNQRAQQWAAATKSMLVKSLIQQGAASHKEGMPEIATQYFLQATEYDPNSEMAWLWLVSVANEPEDKLSYLNRVLSLNPTHEKALALFHRTKTQIARSLIKKGNAAAVAGDRATALEILRDVMEYNPNLEEAWLLKAFLSESTSEKAFCFEKALEINSESYQARNGLDLLKTQTVSEPAESADEVAAKETTEPIEIEAAESGLPSLNETETAPRHLVQVSAEDGAENREGFVEDDTVAPQFVAERYVAAPETVDEERVEEELAEEQISAVAQEEEAEETSVQLPSDFSRTLPPAPAPPVAREVEPAPLPEVEHEEQAVKPVETIPQETFPAIEIAAQAEIRTENINETLFEATAKAMPEVMVKCQFCQTNTKERLVRCQSCGAYTRLEEFDHLLTNELNNEARMRTFIEDWQTESAGHELSADEYFNLGLGYLNLRNVKKAVTNFEQVLNLDSDNKNRNGQIMALIAYINEKMPEVLGSSASASSGKTIMVVDDSPTVRKLIIGKLEKHGHRVVAAVDGMDALSKISETIPDLILLDVTMPRLDGYQLCKMVKANAKTRHVPVVMISGKDGFFDKVRGRMAGSTAYITKPFGPETLLQTVDSYCS